MVRPLVTKRDVDIVLCKYVSEMGFSSFIVDPWIVVDFIDPAEVRFMVEESVYEVWYSALELVQFVDPVEVIVLEPARLGI